MTIGKSYTADASELAALKKLVGQKRYGTQSGRPKTPGKEVKVAGVPNKARVAPEVHTGPTETSSSSPPPTTQAPAPNIAAEELERAMRTCTPTATGLPFANPAEWLEFVMPEIKPYRWQYETLLQLSGHYNLANISSHTTPSTFEPLRYILSAANGSGKDMIIIAAWATWFAVTGQKSKVVGTSSSDDQLKYQTEPHIVEIAKAANKKLGFKFFTWVEHYICIPELGSEIKLFATNEAGRAEGQHPRPGGRMALFVNEAKSVRPEIWAALTRCSGYDVWLEISSPGYDTGHFYDQMQKARREKNTFPLPIRHTSPYLRVVTGDDCPHLTPAHKQALYDQGGDQLVASSWYAQPMSMESTTVIARHLLNYCDPDSPDYEPTSLHTSVPLRIGLDVGAGVDATVAQGWRGNELVFEERVIERNVVAQLPWFKEIQAKHGFQNCLVIADDNGVGQGLIDAIDLAKCTSSLIRVRNQQAAFNKQQYLNAGAEMYANLREHAQKRHFRDLPPHLIRQLSVRRWSQHNGKWKLFKKDDDKALLEGKSPDSADAMALAWFNLRPTDITPSAKISRSEAQGITTADFYAHLTTNLRDSILSPQKDNSLKTLPDFVNLL